MTYPETDSEDSFTKKEKCYVKKQREELRNKKKNQKHKEYQKLRVMVPSIASNPNASKVTVIEEAVRYIDQLHLALLTQLEEKGATDRSDSIRKIDCKGYGSLQSCSSTLEFVQKVDYSIYTKICDQLQAFTDAEKSPLSKKNKGEFDVKSQLKVPKNASLE